MKEKLKIQEMGIDLQVLLDENITPNDYVFMYFVYNNQFNNAYQISGLNREQVKILEYEGYLEIIKEYRIQEYHGKNLELDEYTVKLLPKGIKLFELDDVERSFRELWDMYPQKVETSDGTRILRAGTIDSLDYEICFKKYKALVKNRPKLHDSIIKGLKNQLRDKARLAYMRALEFFLSKREWEKHQDDKPQAGEKVEGI